MAINNAGCPHGCNSLGQILFQGRWEPCPIHGKKESKLLLDGVLPNGVSLYDVLQIPYEYQGQWVSDISRLFLNEDININCSKDSVLQLKHLLETLYNVIGVENNIYMKSIYVYANPSLVDLKSYVYTLQRMAFENNISVVPATSINTICGLLSLQDYSTVSIKSESDISYVSSLNRQAGEGADWHYRTKLTYSDYLRASVCVILDNASTTDGNLRMFTGFLEERAQRGLPTYVFSTVFFDKKREENFYDKSGNRKLSKLNPYLLLGRSQEATAREKGWFKNKSEAEENKGKLYQVGGYTAIDFELNPTSEKPANTFDL